MKVTLPRYKKIAIDVAKQIALGRYETGEKIYSRTLISSQYNVSPETARRAIAVLADLGIVKAAKGSGVTILSRDKAREFNQRYTQVKTTNQLKNEMLAILQNQQLQAGQLENLIMRFFDKTNYYQGSNPLMPVEILIKDATQYLNKTIAEINFWHNTGATVIAIRRGAELLLSPGPYARLTEGDALLFIGDQEVYERVEAFLYG